MSRIEPLQGRIGIGDIHRFDLNPPDIGQITHAARVDGGSIPVSYTLLSRPLYMVEELPRILTELRLRGHAVEFPQNLAIDQKT